MCWWPGVQCIVIVMCDNKGNSHYQVLWWWGTAVEGCGDVEQVKGELLSSSVYMEKPTVHLIINVDFNWAWNLHLLIQNKSTFSNIYTYLLAFATC